MIDCALRLDVRPAPGAWIVNPATSLRWADLDGQWLVFDAGSGQTHLLDALTAAVLGEVEGEPVATAALVAVLADAMPGTSHESLAAAVSTALNSLVVTGMVEPSAA